MRSYALALAVVTAIGCSDSTGPSSVAHHLDAVYRQTCAKAYIPASGYANGGGYNTDNPYWQKCRLMSLLLAGPASGAEPSAVRVTTGRGSETWSGIMIYQYDTLKTGAPYTQVYELIAYSDPDVTTAVVSLIVNTGGTVNTGVYMVASDTITENGLALSDTASRVSLGAPCHETPGLSNPLGDTLTGYPPIEYGGDVCRLATFAASFNATFSPTAGLDPSLGSITVDLQSINGISVIPFQIYFDRAGYK